MMLVDEPVGEALVPFDERFVLFWAASAAG
jgi:hypothetical protein